MRKLFILALLLVSTAILFSCQDQNSTSNGPLENPNDTPTDAYKRLYAAVKSKDTEAIKKELSKKTQEFAKSVAGRQNAPIEKVFANGFTETTFSETLPEIRDERVKDNFGALEVWNSTSKKWDDLGFVRERDGWKLAVGEMFGGAYKSPGKSRDAIEREAINAMSGNSSMKRVEPGSNLSNPPAANAAKNANK